MGIIMSSKTPSQNDDDDDDELEHGSMIKSTGCSSRDAGSIPNNHIPVSGAPNLMWSLHVIYKHTAGKILKSIK